MFTLFHSLKNRKLPTSTTRFYFTDLYLNPSPFPLLKFTILETKNQEVEWHRANSIQLGGFLFIDVPPTSPTQCQSITSTLWKEGSKKKQLLGFWARWAVRKGIAAKTIIGCDRDWQSRSLKQSGNGGKTRGKRDVQRLYLPLSLLLRGTDGRDSLKH